MTEQTCRSPAATSGFSGDPAQICVQGIADRRGAGHIYGMAMRLNSALALSLGRKLYGRAGHDWTRVYAAGEQKDNGVVSLDGEHLRALETKLTDEPPKPRRR